MWDWRKEGRNTVAIKNQTCNHTCEEYIRIDLLGPMSRMVFLNLIQSVSLSLWIESILFVIQFLLLDSKTLGLNVLELQFVMLANYDQNVLALFRLTQSMWLYVKLELSSCKIYYVNLPDSINWELDLIDWKLCRLFFLQNFQLSLSPFDV